MSSQHSEIIEREREFYNASDGAYRRWRRVIWRAIGSFNRDAELHSFYDPRDRRVLLYGCGRGYEASRLLELGATHIAGIDISDAEIDEAKQMALEGGYGGRVDFRVADAHETGFPDHAFDLIVGSSILHHLELVRALREIRRVLAPGGRAVFLEPLAYNPVVRLGRAFTPAARTEDEHPLLVKDWELCAEVFPGFRHREVELTSTLFMPANLIVPQKWQTSIAEHVGHLDDALLRRPRLKRFARRSFLILE
ncbi:MAG: class I SAM-dependent methyltransferase [Solirubrobacteraceae bacterium]